jgi:ribonuclease P protein component
MLPKKNRVDTRTVELIFKKGKSLSSPSLTFKFLDIRFTGRTCGNSPRVSFVAPKSIAKLAVTRNLLRRRGYSALKNPLKHFPAGLVGVFVFKKYQDDVSILQNEIKGILDKIN